MALREVILTVLARGEMSGYEITKDFDGVYAHFWKASHQQVYRELARLNEDGRVSVKLVAQEGKPDKKLYALTRRGLEELKQWLVAPTEMPRPQYDLLVKLLGSQVADADAFRAEVERIRSHAQEWLTGLRAMRRECQRQRESGDWGEHEAMLYLALRRGLLLGEAQSRWLKEVSDYLHTGKAPD